MHSERLRTLFVHLPKTGGESIMAALSDQGFRGLKHQSLREFTCSQGVARAERFRVVSFVRNPWDQVLSFYSHLRKPLYLGKAEISRESHYFAPGDYLHPYAVSRSACSLEFPAWVRRWYGAPPPADRAGLAERLLGGRLPQRLGARRLRGLVHAPYKRQVDDAVPYLMPYLHWLEDCSGSLRAHFVGRFEDIDAESQRLLQWLGLPPRPLPHVNRSQRGDYRTQYDADSRALVARWYAREIEAFGYSF